MINIEQTIISQYAPTSTIAQLVRNMNAYVDPTADIDAFYSFVWNVDTAQGFGLDIWGRIVGVKRTLEIPPPSQWFGFSEATGTAYPFGEGVFYDGPGTTSTYELSNDAYRTLILVKAMSNISTATPGAINQLLRNLFAGRRCYLNDLGGMMIRYTFEFLLTDFEFAIMTQSGALPRPAGVSATLLHTESPTFGFSEAGDAAPFGQAPFISEAATYAIS